MKRRLFLLFLLSLTTPGLTLAGLTPAFASSDDDDHDDDDDDNDDDDDDDDYDDDDDDDDHYQALDAVKAEQAISLRQILRIFRREIGEKIIDISIFHRRGILVYRFKYVDNSGHVLFAFFNAATGIRIFV